MKSCPTCNRTFEDTFTFCLVDGSILSAPFDPLATRQNPEARNTYPPPTEVLPPQSFPNSRDALPPTIPSPQIAYAPPPINNAASYPQPSPQFPQGQYAATSPRKRRPPIPLVVPIILVGVGLLLGLFSGSAIFLLLGLLTAGMLSAINLIVARPNAQNTQGQYMESVPQKKRAVIPWPLPIVPVVLWFIVLSGGGGGIFNLLPVVTLIFCIINLATDRD
ncbi:MAG TPA: hypothetical protein VKB86_06785 [Pyrinomonadaceae bacterium]|nr:hypothetical protein [Pyrinomonadaceae bacterium]